MGQQRRPCQASRDRPARCAGLEDGLALRAGQLGSDRADDLEARRYVLQVLRDVGADAAQPATAGGAAAGLAGGVVVRFSGGGTDLVLLARQMSGQAAVDAAGIGGRRGGLAHGHPMKKTRIEPIEVVHSLCCDRCGGEARRHEAAFQEFMSIDQVAGYGSVFGDGNRVQLDLCPACLKALAGEWVRVT